MNDFEETRTIEVTCPECDAMHYVDISAYAEVWDIDIDIESF